jgi:hypothetical protein
LKHGTILLACLLTTGSSVRTLPDSASGASEPGVPKTALMSFPESENSMTRSYLLPSVVLTGYENPRDLGANPHPQLVLQECRLLTDATERDLCFWYQAGLQTDQRLCEELTVARGEKCRAWVENIRSGEINH